MTKKQAMGLTEIREMDRKQKRLAQGLPVTQKGVLDGGVTGDAPGVVPKSRDRFDTGVEAVREVALRTDGRKPVTREQRELRDNLNVSFSSKEAREDAQFASEYARAFRQVDRDSEHGLPAKGRMRDSEAPRLYRDLGAEEKQVSQENAPLGRHTRAEAWQQTLEDTGTRTARLVRHDQALNEAGRIQKTVWDAGGPRSITDKRDLTAIQNADFQTAAQQTAHLRGIDAKYAARQAELERKTRSAR